MKWITREHVKVDRVACPWLIRKFVDSSAEFYFVPAEHVMSEVQKLGATPFDVPAVELGHRGKECSFEAILKKYNLAGDARSEEHTSELQSRLHLVCRLLLEKKKKNSNN